MIMMLSKITCLQDVFHVLRIGQQGRPPKSSLTLPLTRGGPSHESPCFDSVRIGSFRGTNSRMGLGLSRVQKNSDRKVL